MVVATTQPTSNGVQDGKLGQNTYVSRARLGRVLAPTCALSRRLSAKISVSELSPKFVESALLVGYYICGLHNRRSCLFLLVGHLLSFMLIVSFFFSFFFANVHVVL